MTNPTSAPIPNPFADFPLEVQRRASRAAAGALVAELERIAAEIRKEVAEQDTRKRPERVTPSAGRSVAA